MSEQWSLGAGRFDDAVERARRELELDATLQCWSVLGPSKLVVTQVDEAFCLGPIVAAQSTSALPLAWLTTGQRVPEDLEPASPARLAAHLSDSEEE